MLEEVGKETRKEGNSEAHAISWEILLVYNEVICDLVSTVAGRGLFAGRFLLPFLIVLGLSPLPYILSFLSLCV